MCVWRRDLKVLTDNTGRFSNVAQQKHRLSISPSPKAFKTSAPVPATSSKARVPARSAISAPQRQNLTACRVCGRKFNSDRVGIHEGICRRATNRKRKVFDPRTQRVVGTEAEPFVRSLLLHGPPRKQEKKRPDWRKKHDEFVNTIRAAKQLKAHVAAGGKVSDMPPPPPLDTSDYIQCPHCMRRFNQNAAARHIPLCADMIHNKPRQAGPPKIQKKR